MKRNAAKKLVYHFVFECFNVFCYDDRGVGAML